MLHRGDLCGVVNFAAEQKKSPARASTFALLPPPHNLSNQHHRHHRHEMLHRDDLCGVLNFGGEERKCPGRAATPVSLSPPHKPSPSLSNVLDIRGSTRYTLRDAEKSDISAFDNFPI